jgi:superfamily I DNA and RNA helicase
LVKQASIYGCAGSGKTLLAQKKAEKAAQQNQRTLLCCFNLILGKNFRKFSQGKENLLADNFHNVMKELLLPFDGVNIDFNDDEEILNATITNDIPQFDCILIDEAQDFSEEKLETLRCLLKQDGILYYFWDSNQKIIRNDVNVPDNIFKFQLNTNLRNTVKIFELIQQHYHEDLHLRHKGPEGRDVKVCAPYKADNSQDLFSKLRSELNLLLNQQGLSPKDITILSFKAMMKSVLADFTYNNVNIDCFKDEATPNSIRIDTVRRFKGMESPVVIVTEMDNEKSMDDPLLWDDMCYVSYSRAKNHLIILPPDNVTLK